MLTECDLFPFGFTFDVWFSESDSILISHIEILFIKLVFFIKKINCF